MHLTGKKIEYLLGYFYVDPKTVKYEILRGIYERNDIKNAFKGSVELKADDKTMKTILTIHHD